ncbi:hypothetical protein AB1N83_007945 [Pleurotus pulmonarius]
MERRSNLGRKFPTEASSITYVAPPRVLDACSDDTSKQDATFDYMGRWRRLSSAIGWRRRLEVFCGEIQTTVDVNCLSALLPTLFLASTSMNLFPAGRVSTS